MSSEVNKDGHRKYHCISCLHLFCTENARDKHNRYCSGDQTPELIMPPKDKNILRFNGISKQVRHPSVIFLDIETIQLRDSTYISPNSTDLSTRIPYGYCAYTHYDYGKLLPYCIEVRIVWLVSLTILDKKLLNLVKFQCITLYF